MKASRFSFAVATWVMMLLFAFTVTTAWAKKEKEPKPPAPPVDTRILIQSVDVAANTIVIQYMRDKTTHTYIIDGLTGLQVGNSPAGIRAIKVGMQVRDYQERDPHTLDTITVDQADPPPTPPPAPNKK